MDSQRSAAYAANSFGEQVSWNEVSEPGCYVTEQGSLVRFQAGALKAQHSPLITILSNDSVILTRISDDPFLAVNKAAVIAADMDLPVNFVSRQSGR